MTSDTNHAHNSLCLCGSGKKQSTCCQPFLDKHSYPKTPEKLMRSRFTAFAMGGYGQYLLDTWLPAMTKGLTEQSLSDIPIQWTKLRIIEKSQKGDDGYVTFVASFIDEQQQLQHHREQSFFKRMAGKWLYVGGEVDDLASSHEQR